MTVRDLIAELQMQSLDAEVLIQTSPTEVAELCGVYLDKGRVLLDPSEDTTEI